MISRPLCEGWVLPSMMTSTVAGSEWLRWGGGTERRWYCACENEIDSICILGNFHLNFGYRRMVVNTSLRI